MARKQPHPISKEDFDKLLEAIKKERDIYWKPRLKEYTPTGRRLQDYLIAICLGFGVGMRISEIFGLTKKQRYVYTNKQGEKTDTILTSNIPALTFNQFEEKYIRITGKGKKDRVVPIPTKILRRAGINRADLKEFLPLKTGYRSMEKYITKISKEVLKKHVTFHQLRHGFITHLLNQGVPAHEVMIFSGHARMDTLGIYAHASPKNALDKYEEVF